MAAPNQMVEDEYRRPDFPFEQIKTPDLFIEKELSFEGLPGLLRSWSATQRFINIYGKDPVTEYSTQLQHARGNINEVKKTRWRIIIKAGKLQ